MINKSDVLGLMLVMVCAAGARAENGGTFPAEGLSGVLVSAGGGQLVIEGAAGTSVEVSALDAAGVCEISAKRAGGTLEITKQKGKDGAVSNCRVKLPAKLALEVKMGAGKLEVKNLSGAVQINKVSGKASLSGLTGELALDMVSGSMSGTVNPSRLSVSGTGGNISLAGLACGVAVERVSGGLDLAWAAAPRDGVRIKSAGGKVKLTFPAAAKIATDLKTKENGKVRDDFAGGTGTPVAVTLAGGSVDVIKAGAI